MGLMCVSENARQLLTHEMFGLTRHARLKLSEQGDAQPWHYALFFNLLMIHDKDFCGSDWEHKSLAKILMLQVGKHHNFLSF